MIQSAWPPFTWTPFKMMERARTFIPRRVTARFPSRSIATTALRAAIVLVIANSSLSFASAAEKATVVAEVSASTVRVAEPFSLELTVRAPAGTEVAFPATAQQLDAFEVIEMQDFFDIPVDGDPAVRTWTRRMTLESIVTGDLDVPAIEIRVRDQTDSQTIHTRPITVQVVSVLEDRGDPTKFRDIQSVVDVAVQQSPSHEWAWWTVSGALSLTLVAAIAMVASRRGKWVTPKEWAMRELEGLETSIDSESIDSATASLQLSRIVRDYLLLQFAIPKSGNTPQELVALIVDSGQVDPRITNQLVHLFALADKIKFADFQLTEAGLKSAVNDSRKLVERIAGELDANAPSNEAKEKP